MPGPPLSRRASLCIAYALRQSPALHERTRCPITSRLTSDATATRRASGDTHSAMRDVTHENGDEEKKAVRGTHSM